MPGSVSLLVLFAFTASSLAFPFVRKEKSEEAQAGPTTLDPDLSKLSEYLQKEKENSINVEMLHADLIKRFTKLKQEWVRAENERSAMRKALLKAQEGSKRTAHFHTAAHSAACRTPANDLYTRVLAQESRRRMHG